MARRRRRDDPERRVTVVIPAKNEAANLARLLPEIRELHPNFQILVVDDGSTDDTAAIAAGHGADVLSHAYNIGNGAAVKSGARAALGDVLVFMDADGQHPPADIARLLERLEAGFDMAVGARAADTQASAARGLANAFYNRLAGWMVNRRVDDLTSGFRAVRADRFREFLYLLPNGFSYPATITMAFFRAGYGVDYVPIRARARQGSSHIDPLRDGINFLLIIFRIGTLYSPLKLFVPISLAFFALGGCYYLYTFVTLHRFTNMSALLLTSAVVVFLIGLVSEQVTMLIYRHRDDG